MLQIRTAILALILGVLGYGQIVNSGGGGGGGGGGTCATLTGDVSGSCDANTVDKIKGGAVPVSATVVGTNASAQPVAATTTGTGTTVVLSVSPALTGSPTAPTQSASDNSTKLATTAYVDAKPAPGLVLLEEHTISSGASANFTARNVTGQSGATFQADYDDYEFRIIGLTVGTNAASVSIRCSTNGGSSYDSTTIYDYANFNLQIVGGANGTNGGSGQTSIGIFGNGLLSTGLPGMIASIELYDPLSAANEKFFDFSGIGRFSGDSTRYKFEGGGVYRNATAVNALQFIPSSGNFSGTFRVYGLAK